MYSTSSLSKRQTSSKAGTIAAPQYDFSIAILAQRAIDADPRSQAMLPNDHIIFRIDGEEVLVEPQLLLSDDSFNDLQGRCNESFTPVMISLDLLLSLNDRQRVALVDFVASLDTKPSFTTGPDAEPVADLLSAVLALMPAPADLAAFATAKQAALEVVALLHPTVLETACGQVALRIRELGVKGVRSDKLVSEARVISKQFEQAARSADVEQTAALVHDFLPDAPVPAETIVPANWLLSEAGVRKRRDEAADGIPAPIVMAGRGKDTSKGVEHVCLAWHCDGAWHKRIVEREVVASAQKIVMLAAYGLPVTSNNAKQVVQYLADFEAENMIHLPLANVTRKLGFHTCGGRELFLWGCNVITGDGVQKEQPDDEVTTAEWAATPIRFQGADEGDEQIAAGFHAGGRYEDWREAIKVLKGFPRAQLALYGSLATPLLHVLGAPNMIVDYAGETTGGKTVTLRVGASCFGNPDDQGGNGQASALSTWGGTRVWNERAPAVMNNLPFILDDTKHARTPEDVAATIYAVAQGRTRGRGTVKGTAGQETFSTVMLSSGEQPATSFTQDGGTRGRVITLWGSPFGIKNEATGRLVRRLNDGVCRHYGHAGPKFVQYILAKRELWGKWREKYEKWVSHWEKQAGDNALAGRLARSFAAITLTAELAHQALDLPWDGSDPIEVLWEEIVREASDRPAAALRYAVDWAMQHEAEFYGRRDGVSTPPHQGWAGRWPKKDDTPCERVEAEEVDAENWEPYAEGPDLSQDDWPWIGFFPNRLRDVLEHGGYDSGSTIRSWKDRGWLLMDAEKTGAIRTTCRKRVGDLNARLHVIPRAAVEAASDQD